MLELEEPGGLGNVVRRTDDDFDLRIFKRGAGIDILGGEKCEKSF